MNSRQKEVLQAQLYDEKAVIRKLKVAYGRAMAETEAKIQTFTADIQLKKEALQSVTDASQRALLESEIQSKVYQKQYQEALKGQISAIFDNLQSKQYDTIKEYLDDSYTKGFTGTMYDLHGQGIPLILPIDQTQVVDALTMKTKLSKPLYQRLGVDIDSLKKIVNSEISRGIATGRTWAEIAQIIDRRKNINLYRASRIARTEGHRVQQTAAFDAMKKAKGKGADLVKQWDATLDDRTRPDHALLDGQIREVDEPFEVSGYQAMMPGQFGIASEDIHCRCVALQRARWALDDEELQTLKDRAAYFGLDKSKDFDDFRAKYLKAVKVEAVIQEMNACANFQDLGNYLYSKYAISVDPSVERLDFKTCKAVLGGMETVFVDYPELAQSIKSVSTKNKGVMCCSGETLYFNPKYFVDASGFQSMCDYHSKIGWWPKNSSPASIGVHETGHAVEKLLLKNSKQYETYYKQVMAWNRGEVSKEIVSEALKNIKKTEYGKGKKVAELTHALSDYAATNKQETFAEAFADVFSNGENANPLSLEIKKLALKKYKELIGGTST
jgi:SPP1 gp7 family putative phage head morphogenesis protein|nr:MAG TPA: minor capsid protein [Caudoviricetes sp.]